jgi:hypothetical protein
MKTRTAKQQAADRRRIVETFRKYQIKKCLTKFVAPAFQEMTRSEAASEESGGTPAMKTGELRYVFRSAGQCVCVTCGKVTWWTGDYMNCGHFLASRRNSILLEPDNVACQCPYCNGPGGGMPEEFEEWMRRIRGQDTIDRLRKLKTRSVSFTKEELVDRIIAYRKRIRTAKWSMELDNAQVDFE